MNKWIDKEIGNIKEDINQVKLLIERIVRKTEQIEKFNNDNAYYH